MSHLIGARGSRETYPEPPTRLSTTLIPPLYSVVLRPGDTSGRNNVFTSWTALYAACSGIAGGVRVVGDDNLAPIHIPPGLYDIANWRFDGEPSFVNLNGGPIFHWDDGATVIADQNVNRAFTLGPHVVFDGACTTTPVVTLANGECNVELEQFSGINSLGAHPFFNVVGNAASAFLWLHMENAELGDTVHPTISLAAGSAGQINMFSSEIHAAALAGAGIGGLEVFVSYDSNVEAPNGAANFQWGSLNEDAGTDGLAPTITPNAAAGVGAAASIDPNSTANAGLVSLTPAGLPAPGQQFTIIFARQFNATPRTAVFFPADATTAAASPTFISNLTTGSVAMGVSGALVAGTTYSWHYVVLG